MVAAGIILMGLSFIVLFVFNAASTDGEESGLAVPSEEATEIYDHGSSKAA